MPLVSEKLIVACVQQRMFLPATVDEYYTSLQRFMRVTTNKRARLVIFPELGGLMIAATMLDDARTNLLKRSDRGSRRDANAWQRFVGALSGTVARYMNSDLRTGIAGLLDVSAHSVWDRYVEVFGSLAQEFSVTIVGPSCYLPDPLDGVIRNLSVVFDVDGTILGTQAKVVLHPNDGDLAQPGSSWEVIQTEVGRLGLIIGGDVLYPEVGRLHTYQGADILVSQATCLDPAMYNKIRSGVLARMQDNQLYAATSFLVGPNLLGRDRGQQYVGKSAIFAPQELTPKSNGVLVEMGGVRSEGVVAAEWDFGALRDLWETSDTPIRRTLSQTELGGALGEIYARLQRLPPVADSALLTTADSVDRLAATDMLLSLDDLHVVDSCETSIAEQTIDSVTDIDSIEDSTSTFSQSDEEEAEQKEDLTN